MTRDLGTFALGQLVRLSASFTSLTGAPVDPATVTVRVKTPDGTVSPLVYLSDDALERVGTGDFLTDWPAEQAGRHFVRWESTGAAQAAAEASFTVYASRVI